MGYKKYNLKRETGCEVIEWLELPYQKLQRN